MCLESCLVGMAPRTPCQLPSLAFLLPPLWWTGLPIDLCAGWADLYWFLPQVSFRVHCHLFCTTSYLTLPP